ADESEHLLVVSPIQGFEPFCGVGLHPPPPRPLHLGMSSTAGVITKNFSESITEPDAVPIAGDGAGERVTVMAAARNHEFWNRAPRSAGPRGRVRRKRPRRRMLGALAVAAMLSMLGLGQAAAPTAHATAAGDDAGTPGPAASSAQWQNWAQHPFAQAAATDVAADSARLSFALSSRDV